MGDIFYILEEGECIATKTLEPGKADSVIKEYKVGVNSPTILDCGTVCHLFGELLSPNIGHSSGDISLIGKF